MDDMNALVLSGGGDKFPFEVAAVKSLALAHNPHPKESDPLPWQIIMGVSAGGLVCAGLAGGTFGDLFKLVNVTMNLQGWHDIYRKRSPSFFPHARVLLKDGGSLYDPEGLRQKLAQLVDQEKAKQSPVLTGVGVTDLVTGDYQVVDEWDPRWVQMLEATASIPGMFPGVSLDGRLWMDGGLRHQTPVSAAVDAGATSMTIVLAIPMLLGARMDGMGSIMSRLERAVGILLHHAFIRDMKDLHRRNQAPTPGDRFIPTQVVMPDFQDFLTWASGTLEFNRGKMAQAFKAGEARGKQPMDLSEAVAMIRQGWN